MKLSKRGLFVGAMTLCAAMTAQAQESANSVIGPPQLRDFSLEPKQRIVTQPAPQATPPAPAPVDLAPSAQRTSPPAATTSRETRRIEPAPARAAPARAQATPSAMPAPTATLPPGTGPSTPEPAPSPADRMPAPSAPAASANSGFSPWLYALPVGALALLGVALLGRRRRAAPALAFEAAPAAAAAPPAPVKPRPDPIPRPWLELSLKAERASFTDTEAELQFELEISNQGGSDARNLRLDVKMFNGGAEQDKEIGAFFRTAGRESTKLNLPRVEAGVSGVIHGRVTLARDEMRAMQLDQKLLFIPVVAVNALYDWGEGRTGQTSKSYVIGRELQEPSEKMGAFRVDLGPRVWRTVGQRPHKLTKRV